MAWTYRDAGAWGAGVGRKLTVPEGDGNTWETQQRIVALEGTVLVPRGVSGVVVAGSQWTMTLQDGTVLGPFVMPTTTLKPRGSWTPITVFAALDLVTNPGDGVYLVLQNHTSEATFNPAYQIGGTDVYRQIIDTAILTVVTTLSGGNHTPTVIQAGSHFRCTNAAGCIVTLPNETTAPVPIRTVYQWEQVATGQITFIPEDGTVTVNKPSTRDYRSAEQFAVVSAIKVAANEWTVAGYLAALEA